MRNESKTPYHIKKLQEQLWIRQKANPSYSMRAYAGSLGIHPATLSAILKGKRSLTKSYIHKTIEKLQLTPAQELAFMNSLGQESLTLKKLLITQVMNMQDRTMIEDSERNFNILADNSYYAVLTLLDVEDFSSEPKWIGEKLNLPVSRVEAILEDLIAAKLVKYVKGELQKTFTALYTTDGVRSRALRKSHKNALAEALNKIDTVPLEKRSFSSSTMAIDPENIPAAKKLINEFTSKLSTLLSKSGKKDVYQMNIQLYPLTNVVEQEPKK